jgi:hypothetical protein
MRYLIRRRIERAQDRLRDNCGNWLVLVGQEPYTGEDFAPGS